MEREYRFGQWRSAKGAETNNVNSYDSQCITFIASKTDDVSCAEIVRALKLSKNPVYKAIEKRYKDATGRRALVDERKNEVAQAFRGDVPWASLRRMPADKPNRDE